MVAGHDSNVERVGRTIISGNYAETDGRPTNVEMALFRHLNDSTFTEVIRTVTMATIDTTNARIEESSHAVINLLTTKQYPQDRLQFVRTVVLDNGTMDARVDTDPEKEITVSLLAMITRGMLLADLKDESGRTALLNRTTAKALMVVAGHAGVDLHQSRDVQHLLHDYSFRESWYEETVKTESWRLRDSDKALLIAYFVEVKEGRVITLRSPADWDFLKPVSEAYATSSQLRDVLNKYVNDRTEEAVSLLKTNWDAVLKLADELSRRPILTLQDVLQVLGDFPNIANGI